MVSIKLLISRNIFHILQTNEETSSYVRFCTNFKMPLLLTDMKQKVRSITIFHFFGSNQAKTENFIQSYNNSVSEDLI